MRLFGERTIGHGSCLEPFYDRFLALRLLQRYAGSCGYDLKQRPKCMRTLFVIHHRCVLTEQVVIARAHCPLQCDDGLGTVQMIFFIGAASKCMEPDRIQFGVYRKAKRIESLVMADLHVLSDLFHSYAADSADSACKAAVDHIAAQPDRLKDTRRLVGLQRGDSHFRRNLHNA